VTQPSCTYRGPNGNVLTMDFSPSGRYLVSGGVDNAIQKFDVTRDRAVVDPGVQTSVIQSYHQHNGNIRGLSFHGTQDELLLSASGDGKVVLHDDRADSRISGAQGVIQNASEFTGVQFHPMMDNLFVTSDVRGNVCLRDTRMAFGPLRSRTNNGIVHTYNTKLARRSYTHLSNPESSSVCFDRTGDKLCVTMLHYLPTIYALSDPHPLAVCSGANSPDGQPILAGQRTYSNSCTMKSGTFGGPSLPSDELYAAGSDDFRAYVWRIPELAKLKEERQEISAEDWYSKEWNGVTAFCQGRTKPRYVPAELLTPLCRLNGHRSIVNSVAIHPSFMHIITSGVERHVLLHSATSSSPCVQDLPRTAPTVRPLPEANLRDTRRYMRALLGNHPTLRDSDDNSEDDEELSAISLFDHILRQEGEADVFTIRRWGGSSESPSESSGSESNAEAESGSDNDEEMLDDGS